jgi:Double zinc ribbon
MTPKKKLITRMALWTGVVLVLALAVGGSSLLVEHTDRLRWEDHQKRAREEGVERSRTYLGELAKKIDALPVDPNLVGEVEAHYYEEYASGPIDVWAMGTDGAFLFGVPRESFARLNAIYDREITPRLKEGVFLDRQSFLLGQIGAGDDARLLRELSADDSPEDMWTRLDRALDRSQGAVVLSAPLKTDDGVALGNLYLKRSAPEAEYYRADERLQVLGAGAGMVAILAFVFLWVLLPTWVYVDARERGAPRAPLYAFLTVISSLIGLVVYLIARPEPARTLVCPGCGHEVDGGAFCPHCGRDLSASFCATCRYPLKPDWAFCPACRTEIKSPVPAPETPPAAEAPPTN